MRIGEGVEVPEYRTDVSLGSPVVVSMPAAIWLDLIGWGRSLDEIPYPIQIIYALVMREVLTPRELNERMAAEAAAAENPLRGTPFENVSRLFPHLHDPTDPRNDPDAS